MSTLLIESYAAGALFASGYALRSAVGDAPDLPLMDRAVVIIVSAVVWLPWTLLVLTARAVERWRA